MRITPRVLVGHSFGGKGIVRLFFFLMNLFLFLDSGKKCNIACVLGDTGAHYFLSILYLVVFSMVDQAAKPLARPVRVSSFLFETVDKDLTLALR